MRVVAIHLLLAVLVIHQVFQLDNMELVVVMYVRECVLIYVMFIVIAYVMAPVKKIVLVHVIGNAILLVVLLAQPMRQEIL